jgi:hypothetical protein
MGYSFRDSLRCSLSGLKLGISGAKFFSAGTESMTLSEALEAITVKVPAIDAIGSFIVEAETPEGVLHPAVHVLQWKGPDAPVIIYHHWSNEHPVDTSCRKIFMHKSFTLNASIVLVQAAYHDEPGSFRACTQRLSSFVTMVMTSVAVVEALVQQFNQKKPRAVYVCGLKLGGWITNLHHAFYNSAKAYIPLMAGAGFGDIFVNSRFSSCVAASARREEKMIRRILNFDDLFMSRGTHTNVYPLLARYDAVSNYYRQKTCYGDIPVAVFNKGHFSGATAWKTFRTHIVRSVERIRR